MSKSKTKKKVVVKKGVNKVGVTPTSSRRNRTSVKVAKKKETLLFEKPNYTYMLIGFGLILLGMVLMLGGSMENPNDWDDDVIYSTRIMVFGPILILAGLILEIYAIFIKK